MKLICTSIEQGTSFTFGQSYNCFNLLIYFHLSHLARSQACWLGCIIYLDKAYSKFHLKYETYLKYRNHSFKFVNLTSLGSNNHKTNQVILQIHLCILALTFTNDKDSRIPLVTHHLQYQVNPL